MLFAGPFQYKTGEFLDNGEPVYSRYEGLRDRYDEQEKLVTAFQVKISNAIEFGNLNYYPTIKRHSYSLGLHRYRFHEVVQTDMKWSIFAVLFVMVYMWFHLKSFFLALCGMLTMLMSFPVTQAIYKGVLRVHLYTSLN